MRCAMFVCEYNEQQQVVAVKLNSIIEKGLAMEYICKLD